MTATVSFVRPRWVDMDLFGHVNHANVVTLLEEARVPLLFGRAKAAGLGEFAKGVVVVRLVVDYRTPIVADGRELRVEMSLRDLKFASVNIGYKVHNGLSEEDPVAVTAETVLAPYDLGSARPRRLTDAEREFLAANLNGAKDA